MRNILKLSIVDSSMGSGHFLVNTVYYIANHVLEMVHATEWDSGNIQGDLAYWKAQIVSHCIYGIDLNPLALHLGKLSLWLISAAKNKPLSFIDHHLKVGNSLIGIEKQKIEKQIEVWSQGEFDLFISSNRNIISTVLEKYGTIDNMLEETRDQVHEKKDLYENIVEELALLKRKYDVFLSMLLLDGNVNEENYLRLLAFDDEQLDTNSDDFKEYLNFAEMNHFFHWDLEFPDVMSAGGFDVVIGNPPYVVVNDVYIYKHSIVQTLQTSNLYSYMIERGIKHTSENGKFGMIVPISSISSDLMMPLQRFLINNLSEIYVSSYGIRPSKLFPKVEQRLSIIYGENKHDLKKESKLYTSTYIKWFAEERKDLFTKLVKYAPCHMENIRNGYIPKLGIEIENSIFAKITSKSETLESLIQLKSKEDSQEPLSLYYHSTPGYWIKALDYLPVLQSEKQGEVISTKYKTLFFNDEINRSLFGCILNSGLFYWWWNIVSDCRDLTKRDIYNFPTSSIFSKSSNSLLLFQKLMENYSNNKTVFHRNLGGKHGLVNIETVNHKASKNIIDEIDEYLAECYQFTTSESEFIKNYDTRLRMGVRGEADD